jgi:hypothetical protein
MGTPRARDQLSKMEITDRESMQRFAQEHHVHYDVEPEAAIQGSDREVVGFDVRLLAKHEGSKLPAPGCPQCQELLSELRSFAEGVLAQADAAGFCELVPDPAALYESTEERGSDEVAVTVRIRREEGERAPERSSEDRRLHAVRERLEALGVPQRT